MASGTIGDPHLLKTPPNFPHTSSHQHCRILFISIDGFGDLPANQSMLTAPDSQPHSKLPLPPRSPLSLYRLPNLSRLRQSAYGLLDPVAPGLACGSDTAHLSLLGNNPNIVYRGRGALEGIGGGVSMPSGCIAFKSCLGEFDLTTPEGLEYSAPLAIIYPTGQYGQEPQKVWIQTETNGLLGQPTPHCPFTPPLSQSPEWYTDITTPFKPTLATDCNSPHDNLKPVFMPICSNRKLKQKESLCISLCDELDRIVLRKDGLVEIKKVFYDVSHDDQTTWNYFLSGCRKELKLQLEAAGRRGVPPSTLTELKASYQELDLLPPPIPSITYVPYKSIPKPDKTMIRLDTLPPLVSTQPSQHTMHCNSTNTIVSPLTKRQQALQQRLHPPCQLCQQPYTIFGYCFCQVTYRVFHAGGHRCVVLLSHPMGLSDCVNDTDPCKSNLPLRVSAPKHPAASALFTSMILNRLSRASGLCLGSGRLVLLRGAGMSISLRSPFNLTAVACTHIVAGVAMTLGSNVYDVPEPNGCLAAKLKAVAILLGLFKNRSSEADLALIETVNHSNFAKQFLQHPCRHQACHTLGKYYQEFIKKDEALPCSRHTPLHHSTLNSTRHADEHEHEHEHEHKHENDEQVATTSDDNDNTNEVDNDNNDNSNGFSPQQFLTRNRFLTPGTTALNIETVTPALDPSNFPTTFYHIKTTDDMSHEGDFLYKANVLKSTDDTIGELIDLFDHSWLEWEDKYTNWVVQVTEQYNGLGTDQHGSGSGSGSGSENENESGSNGKKNTKSPLFSSSQDCPCFVSTFGESNRGGSPTGGGIGSVNKCICTCSMPLPPTPIVVCLLGDHSTPCSYAEHSTEPVPVMIHTIYRDANSTTETVSVSEPLSLSPATPLDPLDPLNPRHLGPVTHQTTRVTPTLSEANSVGGHLGRVRGGDVLRFCHDLATLREQEWFILVQQLQSFAQQTIALNTEL